VPHPDYRIQAHVYVASSGCDNAPTSGAGPRGKFHSKSQTTLRHAVADVEAWAGRFRDGEHDEGDIVDCHLLLKQPTASQLSDALGTLSNVSTSISRSPQAVHSTSSSPATDRVRVTSY
jgi:hypothetical protein